MNTELDHMKCEEHGKKNSRLNEEQIADLQKELKGDWKLEGAKLQKEFKFPDFKKALEFTNRVGEVAEREGHHPDIYLTYGKVRLELSTHSAGGLTQNDFILAAKINHVG